MTTMNKILHKFAAGCGYVATLLVLAACQGDWDDPMNVPFGNSSINDENIITIAQLKTDYPNVFASTDQNAKIDRDIKIRGRITGNDLGSNLYKQFTMQDETGGIIIAVNQSGIHGFLAEGQEIVVDLKDLYIGGYRKQPEIGQPYNGSGIGRMNKELFQKHFKYVGTPDASKLVPMEFSESMNKDEHCAKLVILRDVTFTDADGKSTFAPGDSSVAIIGGCVNRNIKIADKSSKVVIRTSTYAKFAAKKLPYDEVNKKALKCDITGIATRFNDTWQVLIRKESDIKIYEN